MNSSNRSRKRISCYDVAVKALLLLICASVGLEGVLRSAVSDAVSCFGPLGSIPLFAALPIDVPVEESPLQPEAPGSSTTSTEIAEGEEEAAGSLVSLSRRHRRVFSRECRGERFYARAIHLWRGYVRAQFEHCFRNGCGAPLRC